MVKYTKFKGKVTGVTDGDTFQVQVTSRKKFYVRLAGVNTPEKGKRGYLTSKKALSEMILGRTVLVDPVGNSYGRLVANVSVNGRSVNKYMMRYSK